MPRHLGPDPPYLVYIFIYSKEKNIQEYSFKFSDGKIDLFNPKIYKVTAETYENSMNNVFFIPSEHNLKIYSKYNSSVSVLMNNWWEKISTSRKISQNYDELSDYRDSLKAGDVTLLGLLVEGGVGLQTGNNGKFVGVKSGTKQAEKIKQSRVVKLKKANKKIKNSEYDDPNYLHNLTEIQIRNLFDSIKEEYGRDIFGQGYLFKIIDDSEIADVDQMTQSEKENGISDPVKYFVPYDKGDRDGNRWWLETPFLIDWSEATTNFFKNNSGKKGAGMPVLRNPQFYFREGLCWTDVNSTYLKCRLKKSGIHDVLSMSLFTQVELPDWYFVCLINSRFISEYVGTFVNSTSHFQINDARQIPIVIPSEEELSSFKKIFDEAYEIKNNQFSRNLSEDLAEKKLNTIQDELDLLVMKLYGFEE